MTEGTALKRLSKVAREFNIGTTTIVEFLGKKGISIENNPNTKLSEDAYQLLFKEFQQEKKLKEATLGKGLEHVERKTISLEQPKGTREEEKEGKGKEEAEDKDLFIKDSKPAATPPSVKEEVKLSGPKVVGKIEEKEEKEVPAEKPEPAKEERAAPGEAAPEETKAPEAEAAEEVPAKEDKKEKGGLKVIGKLDLEETKAQKKPKEQKTETPEEKAPEAPKAPEEEKAKEAEATEKEEQKPEAAKPEEEKKEFFKIERAKLSGPTILGTMELPKEKEAGKKLVASSSDANKSKRRKRKRISKKEKGGEVDVSATHSDKGVRTDAGKARKSPRRDHIKPEVSEEEIQRQVRETLAALSGGGGKSKASKHRRIKRDILEKKREKELERETSEESVLRVTEFIPASELANLMKVNVNEVIATCMNLGLFVSINQRLDAETITIVASEFGFDVEFVGLDEQKDIEEEEDREEDLVPRAPIVTVMGHVNHGKTSLLDRIRHTNVIGGEAGGITQHIGAYSVLLDSGKTITFLDTPGHEAFTAMRARGARVTDVAIIVVAADDNVMPQTVEAINHAQAANVPIVIAINKIDKPSANPERVKEELAKLNVLVEDWGGKYQSQEISAKAGTNVEQLLEKVLLEAELLELKANPSRRASGTVIESSLDKGRGYVTTLLIQNGSMKVGDIVVAGVHHGKVKAMFNERGQRIKEAGPASPVLILGLDGAPQAGDTFNVMESESEARSVTNKRQQIFREQGLRTQKHITLDEIGRRIAIGDFKELNIIVKGDVDGSVEALADSLLKLTTEEVQVNIIHKAVGGITEGDVLLASASNAVIIGFQVRPSAAARKLAEQEEIDIRLYSVIYNAINEIKSAIEGMLSPEIEEKITANLEVRDVFKITKVGTVAGCMVLDGKIQRHSSIRLIRDGIVVYTGTLGSLKRFKDDVKEVSSGYECGLNIERFNDLKVGDIIEAFETIEVARKLD
ncbi:MAG: translation initiation factor IF-2 [Bacteroides sp.]|jgi:translation initiation factor IF-2|nr:translation initiation factor IF-2 [Bacteroides sp.]